MPAENTVSDHYALNWLPFISPEGKVLSDLVNLEVDCAICSKRLAITEPADEAKEIEDFTILPCSHAFCYPCASTWIQRSARSNCPSCRKDLWHRVCTHRIAPRKLQFNSGNLAELIKEIVCEVPERCEYCSTLQQPPEQVHHNTQATQYLSPQYGQATNYYDSHNGNVNYSQAPPEFSTPRYGQVHDNPSLLELKLPLMLARLQHIVLTTAPDNMTQVITALIAALITAPDMNQVTKAHIAAHIAALITAPDMTQVIKALIAALIANPSQVIIKATALDTANTARIVAPCVIIPTHLTTGTASTTLAAIQEAGWKRTAQDIRDTLRGRTGKSEI
ncbi:hypothetical protein F5Y14DRAFT_458950 [Nemania sp. NC0429]|nr:hypothetical protein F5Y14DRAFT_458950 [Nemania sp. NC0429]